jgi:hypothetical protein
MKKDEFLSRLADGLSSFDERSRRDAVNYYEEIISDLMENGKSEEEAVASLGDPAIIAKGLLAEKADVNAEKKDKLEDSNFDSMKQDIHLVKISASNVPVEIKAVPEIGNVHIHFQKTPYDRVEITNVGGVFTFNHWISFSFFHWNFSPFDNRVIEVSVPSNYHGSIDVVTSNGHIRVRGPLLLETTSFRTNNAKIDVDSLHCVSFASSSQNGRITLEKVVALKGNVETSNAALVVERCDFAKQCSLLTSNASIEVESLHSDAITMRSSNASIKGSIVGDPRDYYIKSHTSNGSNSLPSLLGDSAQKKSLSVSTSNAAIRLEFVK